MQLVSLVMGILAVLGLLVGLIPCLGALNWLNIPFAVVGLIVGIVAAGNRRGGNAMALAGIVLCSIAIVVGLLRLMLGGGIL